MHEQQAMQDVRPDAKPRYLLARGVKIIGFKPESTSQKAGMVNGDIIIAYDETRNLGTEKLARLIEKLEPGLNIRVAFVREGHEHSLLLKSGPLGIRGKDSIIDYCEEAPEKTALPETDAISPTSPGTRIYAGLIALAFKTGPKVFSALGTLAKSLKLGKVGLAATSVAAYSYLLSWEFAVLIMVALFVHESGHIWAMKRSGLKTKGIYFIPLLGAAAVSDGEFPSRRTEAFIALMGPIWGLAFAAVTGGVYFFVQEPVLAAAAGWMAAINLFNLLPVSPLDGGRVFKSIAYSTSSWLGLVFLILGVLVSGFLACGLGMGLFVLLMIVGIIDLLVEYRRRVEVPGMTAKEMAHSALVFACVTVMLWTLMSYMNHVPGADLAMNFMKGAP